MVPHGVDDPPSVSGALSPDVVAAIAGGPIVLAFGRINWEKGLDRLIAALPQAAAAQVVVAGDRDMITKAADLGEEADHAFTEVNTLYHGREADIARRYNHPGRCDRIRLDVVSCLRT